jgi:hypothetical protein
MSWAQEVLTVDFSQTCLSLPVTNDGCPMSARFWQIRGIRHLLPVERGELVFSI